MCEVLEVSRSGFYAWQKRSESDRSRRHRKLVAEMQTIHGDRDMRSYGSPRMHRELVARGEHCSENTVAKLMREQGMRAASSRKFRVTTDSNHSLPVSENVLNREFQQESPDRVWLADITYVWTREGWLYLACVLDAYSRKIVGWSMRERITKDLVLEALRMALGRRPDREGGLLHHSDRGSQYASAAPARVAARREHHVQHEPERELLGQRDDGELLRHVEERAASPGRLRDEGRGAGERVRLHRTFLQPAASSLGVGIS